MIDVVQANYWHVRMFGQNVGCMTRHLFDIFFFAKHTHVQYYCFVLVWVLRATVGWPAWIGLSAAPRKKWLSCLHQTSSSPSLSSSSPSVLSSSPSYKHQTSSSPCFHRPCNFNSPIISLPSELPLALSISSRKKSHPLSPSATHFSNIRNIIISLSRPPRPHLLIY